MESNLVVRLILTVEIWHSIYNKTDYLDQDRLFSGRFIDFLFRIGKLRGSIMHSSELNKNEMFEAIDFLTGFTELGGFYYHIGVEKV